VIIRSLKVLLVGEEAAGLQALGLFRDSIHRLVAVMTDTVARGGGPSRLGLVAGRLGHPVWPAAQVKQPGFADIIRREEVDVLLNVHALHVIPAEVVAAPRIGSFNLHPGPLPRYAGLNAPSWAIYHGERTHEVTVHWMDAGIDTGFIAFRERLEVGEEETGLSLSAKCVRAGIPLLARLLESAAVEPAAVPRVPQEEGLREYHGREVPRGGWLHWTETAAQVVRFVRACDFLPFASPWGHPRCSLRGREVRVLKARLTGEVALAPPGVVVAVGGKDMFVAASDEWVHVQSVRIGDTDLAAAEVLRTGDRLAGPLLTERVV
jgi:methionyl-tRNA formyltransferase